MDQGPVGILALQGAVEAHTGAFAALGVDARPVRRPSDLEQVAMLVLPGGESTTMSMLLESSGLLEPVQARLAAGMPAFGTCAGMILLAHDILDGRPDQHQLDAIDLTVRRNAFGRQIESFETELEIEGLDRPFHAVFIRAPLVERVGHDVEIMATVEGTDGPRRAVLCRQGPILVAAFHPELSGDPRLHQLFLESALEDLSTTKP